MGFDMSEINVATTSLVGIIIVSTIFLIFCICIKRSDEKLMSYVSDLAKKKGVKLRIPEQEHPKDCPCGCDNGIGANVAIFIPDVGVVM